MSVEETIRYVLSFLGGGVVSAILAWVREAWLTRRRNEVERLTGQLNSLYGPLHFFTTQALELFRLAREFHVAYNIEYIGREWSREPATQEGIQRESRTTIDIANLYVARINENNERIMQILESNWSMIDPDDTEILARFQVDYTRMRIERHPEGGVITPLRVYLHIGEISYIRQEFIDRVDQKFRGKRARLDQLQTSIFDRIGRVIQVSWNWLKAGWRR